MKILMIIAIAVGLSACGATTIGGGTPTTSNQDQTFNVILNSLRLDNGAGGVTYDGRLDAAAQAHADDMVARDYFAHDADQSDTDGVQTNMVGDRVTDAGYNWVIVGENIGGGAFYADEQAMLDGWEGSPDHFTMMTTEGFEEFGFAVAGSGNATRWVLVMATEN